MTVNNLDSCREFLVSKGYKVDLGSHIFDRKDYLAGSDDSRLSDLIEALFDENVRAILCSRGGYGSQRLLNRIPWQQLQQMPPKHVIGFSDVGAFQIALWQLAGWASISGLQAANGFGDNNLQAQRQFASVLSDGWDGGLYLEDSDPIRLQSLIDGECRGLFLPVCLSILASMIATPFLKHLDRVILCLEDVGEAPYRIDRLFWQVVNSGICDGLEGVVLGTFLNDGASILDSTLISAEYHFGKLGIPIWYGLPYGHFENRLSLPIGIPAQVTPNGTICIE